VHQQVHRGNWWRFHSVVCIQSDGEQQYNEHVCNICGFQAVIVALLMLLLPEESEALHPLHYYPAWFDFRADNSGNIMSPSATPDAAWIDLATSEEMNLEAFAHDLFSFGVGGRMAALFDSVDWGPNITSADREHVTESAQVRQYCVNWPIYNDDSFGNNVRVVMELCGGDVQAVKKARKEYAKYCNLHDSSEHREIE
jgi:hypothetical protein